MTKEQFIAHLMEYYDEMELDSVDDCTLQHYFDADSQTLRIHVLSECELETLAGHCAESCEECLWAESCEDAHGNVGCGEFVQREGDTW